MANTKKTESPDVETPAKSAKDYLNEKVEITLFRDGEKYREPLYVSVNGHTYLIQRGKPVFVPRKVAFAIEDAIQQDAEANDFAFRESEKFTNTVANVLG